MEKMVTTVEGVCHEASVSKSSGSEFKQTRFSVDLNLPLPMIVNGENCQYFSIRQYVAEMREKNMKNCSLFESSSNPSEQLPLDISEHKQCSTREIETNYPVANLLENGTNTDPISSNDGNDKVIPHEILYAEGKDSKIDSEKGKDSQNKQRTASNTSDPSEPDTIVAPKDNGIKISQKKRNMSQEDGCRSRMNLDGKMDKRLKAYNQNQKVVRSSMEMEVTDSCLGENGSDRKQCQLQSGSKNVRIKHTNDKHQAQVFSANILIQSSHASPSTRKVEHHLRNNYKSLHGKERESSSRKLFEVRHASSHMNMAEDKNLQRQSLSNEIDVIQLSIGMGMETSQTGNKLYFEEKPSQNLSSFMGAHKHVENDTIQSKSITNRPLTLQKSNKTCNYLRSNTVESDHSLRKAVNPIERQSIMTEPRHSLRKGVNPLIRESIVAEPRQYSRTKVIDLNQRIDLNQLIDLNHWQDNQSSPHLLQWENLQIQKSMETPRPSSKRSLNEVQGHSYITNPQRNQQPPMGIYPQSQNRVFPWLNPPSTNFHPMYANVNANVGVVKDNTPHFFNVMENSTAVAHIQEQQSKLFDAYTQSQWNPSNVVQVSVPIPIRWDLQHSDGLNHVLLPSIQNIAFEHDNQQNYCNQENNKLIHGQDAPGSHQKGRTISDIKNVDLHKAGKEHMSTKGMSATQLLRHQERPFLPCNIHSPFHMDGSPGIFKGHFLFHHQLNESSGVHIGGLTTDQVVSLGQEKKRKAHPTAQLDRRKLQQSASLSHLLCFTRDPGPSSFKVAPLQDDNVSRSLSVGSSSAPAVVLPITSILKKDPPCLFNQNPADIADADDEKFFRTAEDRGIQDNSSLQEKFGAAVKFDGRKRQMRMERSGRMPIFGLMNQFC